MIKHIKHSLQGSAFLAENKGSLFLYVYVFYIYIFCYKSANI
jgi:hypothetical protein